MSKKYSLNYEDGKKILKGLAIAMGGAGLTFIADITSSIDFGDWTPVAVALSSVFVNLGYKFLKGR